MSACYGPGHPFAAVGWGEEPLLNTGQVASVCASIFQGQGYASAATQWGAYLLCLCNTLLHCVCLICRVKGAPLHVQVGQGSWRYACAYFGTRAFPPRSCLFSGLHDALARCRSAAAVKKAGGNSYIAPAAPKAHRQPPKGSGHTGTVQAPAGPPSTTHALAAATAAAGGAAAAAAVGKGVQQHAAGGKVLGVAGASKLPLPSPHVPLQSQLLQLQEREAEGRGDLLSSPCALDRVVRRTLFDHVSVVILLLLLWPCVLAMVW